MYGYIRPDRGELRGREYELFRAEYCGLCQTLRERYGAAARFVVNYDLTFLAMVLSGDKPSLTSRRCPVHPMQKRPFANADPALEAAADYSVILTWWKLLDTLQDETGLKAAAALAGETAFRRAYRKAALRRPAFDANVRERLAELSRLEGADEKSLDRAADCFASILAAAGDDAPDTASRRIRRELFYHVGRSVYILDAVDDLSEDLKTGSYNPLRHRLKGGEDTLSAEEKSALRATLNLSQRSACAALSLREPDAWQPILENILTVGLPEVTELVFSGRWNKRNDREHFPRQGVDEK